MFYFAISPSTFRAFTSQESCPQVRSSETDVKKNNYKEVQMFNSARASFFLHYKFVFWDLNSLETEFKV